MSGFGETYDMGKRHGYDKAISDLTQIALGRTDVVEQAMLMHAVNRLRDKVGAVDPYDMSDLYDPADDGADPACEQCRRDGIACDAHAA